MITCLSRVAITVGLAVSALATTLGDHKCAANEMCGDGSEVCAGWGTACTSCAGATVTDVCLHSTGSTCTETGNVSCGSTRAGTCSMLGYCSQVLRINGNCQVLKC